MSVREKCWQIGYCLLLSHIIINVCIIDRCPVYWKGTCIYGTICWRRDMDIETLFTLLALWMSMGLPEISRVTLKSSINGNEPNWVTRNAWRQTVACESKAIVWRRPHDTNQRCLCLIRTKINTIIVCDLNGFVVNRLYHSTFFFIAKIVYLVVMSS